MSESKNLKKARGLLIDFDRAKLIRWFFSIVGILAICDMINVVLGNPSWQLERLFEMSLKNNIPLWYSAMLLMLAALVAFRCFQLVETKKEKWLWLSVVFVFWVFSIDEVALIHQHLFRGLSVLILPQHARHSITAHFSHTDWPILASPFLVALVLWFVFTIKNLFRGSSNARNFFVLGLVIFVTGGWLLEILANYLNHDSLQWVYDIHTVLRKSLELIGTITVVHALFLHEQVLAARQQ